MTSQFTAFVARRWGVPADAVSIDVDRLHGGLESSVTRATVNRRAGGGAVPGRFVVKELAQGSEREADVYDLLWTHLDDPPAVRLLGRERVGGATYLYLEHADAVSSWPWSETAAAAAVCRALARLHDRSELPRRAFTALDDRELLRSAESTLELALAAVAPDGRRYWRRLGDLRRLVAAFPGIRARLLAGPTVVIHGDVHPGNVVLSRGTPEPSVVLLDWGRTRIGSPMEDIASWLHSLGCWEPQARRRHDTLMRAYLEARRHPRPFDDALRLDYWLASASNGLSGAIRYHLAAVADPGSTDAARSSSRRAMSAWERVVRRASSLVRTSPDRDT
jgi:aminoglycoside phosphotransferase (APT) family kinase protein